MSQSSVEPSPNPADPSRHTDPAASLVAADGVHAAEDHVASIGATRARRDRFAIALRVVAIIAGAGNAAAGMAAQAMGHEGINYLDQGDAWLRGDWATALNGTWSPLYAVLLGGVMRAVGPSIELEFPLVHVVNFSIYVGALLAFEFFWRQVAARYHDRPQGVDVIPSWAFTALGYGLFMWTTLCLIRVFTVTPDMLVASAVFLSAGLLLRLMQPGATPWTAALLGMALGAAFLAKALTLAILLIALTTSMVMLMRAGRVPHALAAAAGFIMVAAPFIVALSRDVGQLTAGETGRVSYLKYVLAAPFPHYRHGSPDVAGTPDHPVEFAPTVPAVVRFDAGMPVTYPPVYDQQYWYAGLAPTLRPALQVRAISLNLQRYFELFVRQQGLALAVLAVLLIVRGRRAIDPAATLLGWIGLAAIGWYSLVYAEERLVAPFIVLLWTAALLVVQLPSAPSQRTWLRACSIIMLGSLAANIAVFHLDGLNAMFRLVPVAAGGPVSRNDTGSDNPVEVARALREAGVVPGDRIGVIGDALHASWARLARVRIVAEVPPHDVPAFWLASAEDRTGVLAAFRASAVRAVIAQAPLATARLDGWSRLGATSFYVRVGEGAVAAPETGR